MPCNLFCLSALESRVTGCGRYRTAERHALEPTERFKDAGSTHLKWRRDRRDAKDENKLSKSKQ